MDNSPYYHQDTVDRCISKLINKQYPEDEFVLDDDDIIVLTKVDIRANNREGETDESDDDTENDFAPFYHVEDVEDISESDDEFIDDRPESQLTEESDNAEDEQEEDKEYDSDPEDENDQESGNEDKSDSEPESINENESDIENESENLNGNKRNILDDSEDDEEIIKSPNKKAKLNVIRDDTSESSDEEGIQGRNDEQRTLPSEQWGESSSSQDASTSTPSPIESTSKNGITNGQQKDVNTFGVYFTPKIYKTRMRLQYSGRIGMCGIKGYCRPLKSKKKFCDFIHRKRALDQFTRINLMYVNARHLEYRRPDSKLPKPVRKFLIHLIDQWFPIGIPLEIHLNRAIDLLECLKQKISEGKLPSLKHSNKFYALIPHQGDPRRRPRFTNVELCNNKIKFVETMRDAVVDCFSKFDKKCGPNPLDYFIDNWLRIELHVLDPNDTAYEILNEVIVNTQNTFESRRFCVANIFKVDNMNPEANGDFSTDILENHRYLFHYTFASNLPCILREGLLVAPPHIHSVSRFLGDGIYFWDAVPNAGLNYKSLSTVYVLVCRVALGKEQQVEDQYLKHDEILHWNDDTDSIYCPGKDFSSVRDDARDLNGAKIYCGKLVELTGDPFDRFSLYNKYVVRNKNQVIVEYIIKFEKK